MRLRLCLNRPRPAATGRMIKSAPGAPRTASALPLMIRSPPCPAAAVMSAARATAPFPSPCARTDTSLPVRPPATRTAAARARRHEPAGHERPAEFLDRDGELRQAEALPAVGLGYVQAEQALIGQARPEHVAVVSGAAIASVCVGGRPGDIGRAMPLRPRLGPSRRAVRVLPSGRAPSVHLICHDPAASAAF